MDLLSYIGPFFLLLGFLVFIHELGHFLIAKLCGVRVEVFSLGFGKKILKYKKGYTTYCISLIPLGGYVKLFGDNPRAELTEKEKKHAFLSQPVGSKIAIVLGGPLMNLFFAIFVYSVMAYVGQKKIPNEIGDLSSSHILYQKGVRSGDQIISVNGKKTIHWEQVDQIIKENPSQKIIFEIKNKTDLKKVSLKTEEKHYPLEKELKGFIPDLNPFSEASFVGISSHKKIAFRQGFRNYDEILSINGKKLNYFREIEKVLKENRNNPLEIKVKNKNGETKIISILKWKKQRNKTYLNSLGLHSTQTFIGHIKRGSSAFMAGIKKDDLILKINGKQISSWMDIKAYVDQQTEHSPPMLLDIFRKGKNIQINLKPKIMYILNEKLENIPKKMIGVGPVYYTKTAPFTLIKEKGLINSFLKGISLCSYYTSLMFQHIKQLVQGKISYKTVQGVISIGKYAGESFRSGWYFFLQMMALVSLNLFFINLLPIPILDGGHLVFFIIEAIKGSPLDLKYLESANYIGFVFLIGLMFLTFYNDIYAIVFG